VRKYTPLETWIREALTDSDKEGPCSAMSLLYCKPGGGHREIHSVKLTGKTHDAKTLSDLFQGRAETAAQDFGGISNFEIQAFYGKSEAQAYHTISIIDGEMQSGGKGRTVKETNDGPGIVAQSMRHTENAFTLLAQLVQNGAVTSLQREQAMATRETELRNEVNEAYKIVREMMMSKTASDHEMHMKELQFRQTQFMHQKIMELVPALANTVSGRDIFPQSTADTALIEALATRVKPEMIEQLGMAGILPPELLAPLAARFSDVLRKKKEEAEAVKKLAPSNPDPMLDATGEGPTSIVSTNGSGN
jgi:hypothetical protein